MNVPEFIGGFVTALAFEAVAIIAWAVYRYIKKK